LGNFHLVYDGNPVPGLDSPRLQSFLAYLLIHRDAPLQRQHLAFIFWPDSSESQARTNLRNLLYRLREAFPEVDDYLEINQQTLWWKPKAAYGLDLDQFEGAAAHTDQTGSGTDQAAHLTALTAAVEAYRGDLLPGCYDDWIQPERERLSQIYLRLLEELVEILEVNQDYDPAIQYAQQLIRQDPLLEISYQRLMAIYLSSGERARAVRTYHQCVEVLEKEMGLDPSPETRKLYRQIMEREVPAEEPSRVTEKRTRLVGRDRDWNILQKAWLDHQIGGHLAVIMGEAGVGKTYLAEEFIRWAKKGGITCLKTRSYPTEDELAYTPVTALLRNKEIQKRFSGLDETWLIELARLLPEMRDQFPDLPDPEKLSESWKRQRMFEASAQALLGDESRLVLILDDLQWCDRETLDWLRFMLECESNVKFLVIGGVRTEDLTADSPLIAFFADLGGKNKITEILLDRLDLEATRSLAANLWGEVVEERAAARLYQETEGNPLFVAEMVRAGYFAESEEYKLPPRVQAVIETRLNALSSESRDLAALAAVVGREFDFELLFRTGEIREEELLGGLDELWSRRLIRDEGAEGYNFSHDKFREVLYGELSPHRRTHYHKKVARALEEINADQLEAAAPQLAYQFNQAGDKNRALDYYLLAGDQARVVYAREDAVEYYQAAAEILGGKQDPRAFQLYQGWGNALLKLARYEGAAAAYQQMAVIARAAKDSQAEAQSWLAVSKVQDRQGNFKDALLSAEQAAKLAEGHGCEEEKADAVLMKGQQHYRLGEADQAEVLVNEALELHQKRKDQMAVGRCLNLLGLVQDLRGNFRRAREYKEQAIQVYEEIQDQQSKWWIGNITLNLANSANLGGEYQTALELYQKARETMREIGDQDWEILCLFNLGGARVGLEDYQLAEQDLKQVLDLTESSGWLGLSLTHYFLAESYLGQGKVNKAGESAQKALQLALESGSKEFLGAAWRALGKVASQQDGEVKVEEQTFPARECFKESEQIYREAGADGERAYTLKAWAAHEMASGDKKRGAKLGAEAREIFQRLEMTAELKRMDKEGGG
jgi:DNA-binding SARP family transcriptional activator